MAQNPVLTNSPEGMPSAERHMRLLNEDKQTHHCNVHFTNHLIVDAAGIGGRKMLLPGEVSVIRQLADIAEKSAEAILVVRNEPL